MANFGKHKIGDNIIFRGGVLQIVDKRRGSKNGKANYQSGLMTGIKSNPTTYLLTNGLWVRGDKIKRHHN